MRPANSNPLEWVRPSNNRGRVDSLVYNDRSLLGIPCLHGNFHRSFRIRHNMPLDFHSVSKWFNLPEVWDEPFPVFWITLEPSRNSSSSALILDLVVTVSHPQLLTNRSLVAVSNHAIQLPWSKTLTSVVMPFSLKHLTVVFEPAQFFLCLIA